MMAFASVVEDVIERSGIRDDVKDLLRKQRAREAYEREQAKKQEAENLAMVEQVLGDMKREEADVARVEKELAELERREAAGEVTMAEVDAKREQLLRERAEVEESRRKVKELDLSHAASQKAQALMEEGMAELDRAEQEGASPTYLLRPRFLLILSPCRRDLFAGTGTTARAARSPTPWRPSKRTWRT